METIKYKPKMISVPCPISTEWDTSNCVPIGTNTIAMVKADGEFTKIIYKDGLVKTYNRSEREETSLTIPALRDLEYGLKIYASEIKSFECLLEMHVRDGNKRLRVNDYIHALKGNDYKLRETIHLGFFDLIELNGVKYPLYSDRLDKMEQMLEKAAEIIPMNKTTRFYVLPHEKITSKQKIETFWYFYVEPLGYEGIVINNDNEIYKLKPDMEMDAVVVGIVKKGKQFPKGQAGTLRVALMPEKDVFLEVANIGGLSKERGLYFYNLYKTKCIDDTKNIGYIKPEVVVKLKFIDFYENEGIKWRLNPDNTRTLCGKDKITTLRSPKISEIRTDKKAIIEDVGINQFPER